MTRPVDTRHRVLLALRNVDMVSVAVSKALADGAEIKDIVVLLLDTRDPVARDFAVAIIQHSSGLDLDAEEARALRRDQIPTGIAVLSVASACALFSETHPGVAEGLRLGHPAGRVRVVAIGEGGATLLHLAISAPTAFGLA